MKCKIPEISWHNRDPVLSVDIQSKCADNSPDSYRLASGGTDSHVLIWFLSVLADGSDINLELAADLTRHQRAVNVVKWSPNGELLASGDDESVIFIWKQKTETDPPNILENTTEQDKEIWLTLKILRGHMEDVYDLSWSPNSQFLVSGSVDNSAMIWDVYKGKSTAILKDHKGFVQGVAWDPCNQYVATMSTDRYLRIFDIQSKRVVQRINKSTLNVPDGHALHGKRMRLFHDDTLQTFFRRLRFSPDGKLLLTPAGVTDFEGCSKPLNATYGFSRFSFRQPALILPCPDQYTVAVSCCPLLFALRPYNREVNPPVVPLPYRMIFAVATRSSVYFYDTQQHQPFAIISNIHYTRLTDITWSSDGRVVVVSSTDGFCSLITFEKGELGEQYGKSDEVLTKIFSSSDSASNQGNKKSKKQKENDAPEPKSRKPSVDESVIKPKSSTDDNKKIEVWEEKSVSVTPEELTDPQIPRALSPKEAIIKPLLAADIILDKEILSSDEKFESPEKKSSPATPIMVRRHPRTPKSNNEPASTPTTPSETIKIKNSPQRSASKNMNKTAKPIAVRRTPRAIIPAAVEAPILAEEAMDAWPTQIPPSPESKNETKDPDTPATSIPTTTSEMTSERTEDIRLVYEDTVEVSPKNSNEIISNSDHTEKASEAALTTTPKQNKTPRRVEFKTISTPKSKKQL